MKWTAPRWYGRSACHDLFMGSIAYLRWMIGKNVRITEGIADGMLDDRSTEPDISVGAGSVPTYEISVQTIIEYVCGCCQTISRGRRVSKVETTLGGHHTRWWQVWLSRGIPPLQKAWHTCNHTHAHQRQLFSWRRWQDSSETVLAQLGGIYTARQNGEEQTQKTPDGEGPGTTADGWVLPKRRVVIGTER